MDQNHIAWQVTIKPFCLHSQTNSYRFSPRVCMFASPRHPLHTSTVSNCHTAKHWSI